MLIITLRALQFSDLNHHQNPTFDPELPAELSIVRVQEVFGKENTRKEWLCSLQTFREDKNSRFKVDAAHWRSG